MTIQIKRGNLLVISRTGFILLLAGKLILEVGCQSGTVLAPYTPSTNTVTTTVVPPATTVIDPPSTVFVIPVTTTLPPVTIFRTVAPPQTTSAVPPVTTAISLPTPPDRLYSTNHMWVKKLSANTVQIGVTAFMVNLLSQPYALSLPQVGAAVTGGSMFGEIEGNKLHADMVSPVSGTVIQVNNPLVNYPNTGSGITPIVSDPYGGGWMITIQLSNPTELNYLLSSIQYDAITQN